MIQINENIFYLPKQTEPLSAEVFFIKKNGNVYIYDVGNGEAYITEINRIENKNIILSHFHPDHIYNLKHLSSYTLYQSKNTFKYTKIENYFTELNDDVCIFEIPSSHAKGSLGLLVDGYLFVGDAFYMSNKGLYNVNALNMQIKLLESKKIEYVVCSHQLPNIKTKLEMIEELKSIYKQRDPKQQFIQLKKD